MRLLILLSFLLGLPAAAAAEASLAEILARVEAAYGTTAPAAIRETGTTSSQRRGEGRLTRLYRAPDHFRIDIAYAGGGESRGLAGPRAWAQEQAANPALRGAIVLQAARIGLPWNLLARRAAALDRGSEPGPDGRPRRAVELPLEEGLRLLLEIDPESGRILRPRGLQNVGPSIVEFATEYSDFRRRGERLHAALEQHYAMGRHIGHSTIEQVDYPATIGDDEFLPPGAR